LQPIWTMLFLLVGYGIRGRRVSRSQLIEAVALLKVERHGSQRATVARHGNTPSRRGRPLSDASEFSAIRSVPSISQLAMNLQICTASLGQRLRPPGAVRSGPCHYH